MAIFIAVSCKKIKILYSPPKIIKEKNMSARVRFAPSPTGFLHIGNARTALFNYLFAKKNNGKFLLRIEDTDKERSTEEAVDVIIEGLKWLGLHYDDEIIFQSANIEKHKAAAEQLIAAGKAYKCYATAEEVEKLRFDAREDNHKVIYPDRNGVRDLEYIEELDYVVRLKTPMEGEAVIYDQIQGEVRIQNSEIDDFVLLRSDGTPTYMLAVVVDDIEMEISHIIRGDDHLINAFRQAVLFDALGAKLPKFAHMPLIHGDDGAKLSKRHGALSVTDWRQMGYPAEMILNYLAGLGWSMGNKEVFTVEEASGAFGLKKVSKSPSRLDFDKINHLSGLYLRAMDAETLIARLNDYLKETKQSIFDADLSQRLLIVADLFKQRASHFAELRDELNFFRDVPEKDEKAKALLDDEVNKERLGMLLEKFQTIAEWKADNIAAGIKEFLAENELKMPKIGPVLRSALAGRTSTPDLGPILEVLGKETVIKRIETAL